MKRGAEFQLTKDDPDVKETDPEDPGRGLQKASENELAARKIKPLPSRLGRAGAPKPAFSGFPASSAANPFLAGNTSSSISSIPTTPPILAPASSTSPFFKPFDKHDGAPPAAAPFSVTPSPSAFSIPPATTTSPATSTSKAFASILNTSGTNIFATPVSSSPPVATTTSLTSKARNGTTESSLKKYYTDLRGLNVSTLNFIKNSVEGDPFCDLAGALESYKTHRSRIQKDYDEAPEKEKATTSAPAPPKPSIFEGFGSKATSSTSSAPDMKAASSSIFGAGSNLSSNSFSSLKPASASESSSTTNIFGAPSLGSSFGNFSTPGPSATTTTFSTFSDTGFGIPKPPSADKSSTSTETPSLFGSSTKLPFPLSSSSMTASKPFGAPATNLFGSPASSTSVFGAPADSSSSDKTPGPSNPFSLPSVAKNTGVFYAFGSGPQNASTSNPTSAAASEVESQETTTEDGAAETGSEGAEPREPPLPGLLTPNPHDEEGVGEENEETVHAVKLKAYRMRRASEQGGSGWAELGMGILRLKRHKDTDARRMLLRNSTNGKININFNIYSGLKPSISKKALTFVGHFEGASQTYCVRLPSEGQASELKTALEREIDFVKSKESS